MAYNSEQLSADLLLQIDRLRGNTPRDEFLRNLVHDGDRYTPTYHGQPAAYPSLPPGVDRREFDDFRHEMRAILKDLIDYVVPSEGETPAAAPPTPPEKGRLRRAVAARLGRKEKAETAAVEEVHQPEADSEPLPVQEEDNEAKSPRLRIYYGKPGHPGSRVEEVTPVKHSGTTKTTPAQEALPAVAEPKGEESKLDKIVTLLEQVLTRPSGQDEEVPAKAKTTARQQPADSEPDERTPRLESRGPREDLDRRGRQDRRRVRLDDEHDLEDDDYDFRDEFEYEPAWDPRLRDYGRSRDRRVPRYPPHSPSMVPPYSEVEPHSRYQPHMRDPRPDTVITATLDSISRNLNHLNRKMTRLERKRNIDTPPLPPLPPIYRYLDVPAEHLADPVAYSPPDDPFMLDRMAEEIDMLTPPWARPRRALPEPQPTTMGAQLNRRVSGRQQLQLQAPFEDHDPWEDYAPNHDPVTEPEPREIPAQEATDKEVTETITPAELAQAPEFPQELEETYRRDMAQAESEAMVIPEDGIFMPGSMDSPKGDLESLRAQLEADDMVTPSQPRPAANGEPETQPGQAELAANGESEDGIFMPGQMGGPKGDLNGLRAQLEASNSSPPVNHSQEGPPASKEAKPPEANGAAQEYPEDGIIMPGKSGNSSGGSDTSTNGPSRNNSNGGSASSLNDNEHINDNVYPNGNGNGQGDGSERINGNGDGQPRSNGSQAHTTPLPNSNHNLNSNSNSDSNWAGDPRGLNRTAPSHLQSARDHSDPATYPGDHDPSNAHFSQPFQPSYPSPSSSPAYPASHLPPDIPSAQEDQYAEPMTYPGTYQEYHEPIDEVDTFIQALRSSGQPLNLDNARPLKRPKRERSKRLPAPPINREITTTVVERKALPAPEPEPKPQSPPRTATQNRPMENEDADLAEFEAQMSSRRRKRPRVPAEVEFDYQDPDETQFDDDLYEEEYADEDDLAPPDEEVNLPPWKTQFDFLWLGAVLMFGIGDVVSTWWAVQNGAQEANPFLHQIVHDNFMVFILIKVILLGVAFLYSYVILMENGHDARFMPAVFILAGAYLVVNNYMVTQELISQGGGSGGFTS